MLGVGLDAVELDRFRRSLERTPGLVARLFTEGEIAYARQRDDPTERFAARFAAKEAVMKALGIGLGECGWHDVEVVRAPSGQPSLVLRGRAAELAAAKGVAAWHLSLTHTDRSAQAIAIAE
jgi:holo-[acyl-carrier protein] synthase